MRSLKPKRHKRRRKTDDFSLGVCIVTIFLTIACGLAVYKVFRLFTGSQAMASTVFPQTAKTFRDPRIVIVKHDRLLHLFDGRQWVRSYRVALGQPSNVDRCHPATDCTPEGTFYICSRNVASRFRRFLGISYPDEPAVQRGLSEGLISQGQAEAIREALRQGRQPDWTTPLGGGFGLHGGGNDRDWTAGCVALADQAIEELDSIVRLGDPVEILP
jgi:hypothetical protein